ncbi:hypothetical protein D9M68_732920 [compost metagenome]
MAVRVVAVKRARRRLAGEVHAAGPEAALRVALAVVEAVAGQLGLGLAQVAGLVVGGGVEQGKAPAQGDDQARRVGALGQRRNLLGKGPARVVAADRVQPVQLAGQDVHPVQRLFAHRPEQAFAQLGARGLQAAQGPHHGREKGARLVVHATAR